MLFFFNILLINKIKLKHESMLDLSFENYKKDFTFIVNNNKFSTSRIMADILSSKINQLHITDPKVNKYKIETSTSGNFSYFLQLINFNFNDIPESEIPFINEVATILENQFIIIEQKEFEELTIENVIEKVQYHEKYPKVYSKQIEEEIEFLSKNFYLLNITQESTLCTLDKFVLDKIFNNSELTIRNEDQLLNVINIIYNSSSNYSYMYEYVDFNSISDTGISSFLQVYNYNDLTPNIWQSFSNRKSNGQNDILNKKHKMRLKVLLYQNEDSKGIFGYLKKYSNNMTDEIQISAYKYSDSNLSKILFADSENFYSDDDSNQWITIEFKNHLIIPTNYTIKASLDDINNLFYSYSNNHPKIDRYRIQIRKGHYPKSWVIEVSNDNNEWVLIDKQDNCQFLQGPGFTHTFQVQVENPIKYFRMRLTGPNSNGNNILGLNFIELYGILI